MVPIHLCSNGALIHSLLLLELPECAAQIRPAQMSFLIQYPTSCAQTYFAGRGLQQRQSREEKKVLLRRQVQELFNKKYSE